MPIYEYRCRNGHQFEVFQSMSDEPVRTCEVCGAPVERVFRPVAVHFKGSGFYTTDYARKGKAATDGGAAKEAAGEQKAAEAASSTGDKSSASGKSTAPSKGDKGS